MAARGELRSHMQYTREEGRDGVVVEGILCFSSIRIK
jgi:hypothetical protein